MNRMENFGLTEACDKAHDLHILTPDLYDRWHASLDTRQQNWLNAQNFEAKPGALSVCQIMTGILTGRSALLMPPIYGMAPNCHLHCQKPSGTCRFTTAD